MLRLYYRSKGQLWSPSSKSHLGEGKHPNGPETDPNQNNKHSKQSPSILHKKARRSESFLQQVPTQSPATCNHRALFSVRDSFLKNLLTIFSDNGINLTFWACENRKQLVPLKIEKLMPKLGKKFSSPLPLVIHWTKQSGYSGFFTSIQW